MHVRLAGLTVALMSENSRLLDAWGELFAGWEATGPPDVHVSLAVQEKLPALPPGMPLFADERAIVDAYQAGDEVILYFHDAAYIHLAGNNVTGAVKPEALDNGRLEDVTFTALAPLLRRRGYYLVHGFAAARNGVGLLLCGQSGSGKTTSGTSLLLGGWQLLANDAVLLKQRAEGIYALPTPGAVQVRPPTLFLLPALRHRRGRPDPDTHSYIFPATAVSRDGWGTAAPLHALFFPSIEAGSATSWLAPLPRAVALAYLLEESVDRWDDLALEAHTALLTALVQQADVYRLHLGTDVQELPTLLSQVMAV